MAVDLVQSYAEFGLSPHITEFLADVIVLQRYVELEGRLEKVLAVVKMRNSSHDRSIRRYAIEASGAVVGEPVQGSGILTGVPLVRPKGVAPPLPGLTRDEAALARRAGLKGSALTAALDRLLRLEYVSKVSRKGVALYRARMQKR
jgi:hypothetical protein